MFWHNARLWSMPNHDKAVGCPRSAAIADSRADDDNVGNTAIDHGTALPGGVNGNANKVVIFSGMP
jgi:hypothetical protein